MCSSVSKVLTEYKEQAMAAQEGDCPYTKEYDVQGQENPYLHR